MLEALAALLVFQTIGEMLAFAARLPIPGPVLGMALLLAFLLLNPNAALRWRETGVGLLRHLSLLFVPAGVGVMLHASRLESEWLPIVVAVVVSTASAIAVAALVVHWAMRWTGHDETTPMADKKQEPKP